LIDGGRKTASFLYALTSSNIDVIGVWCFFETLFHKEFVTARVGRKLSQRFIDRAIGQWRRRLQCVVQQQGGHIEHLM